LEDDDEDELELVLFFLEEVFGRMTTSCGFFDDLIGMRVMTGPVARRVEDCFFLLELDVEVVLLLTVQSVCFKLPHL